MSRIIVKKNKKITDLVVEYKVLALKTHKLTDEITELQKQITERDDERNKTALKIQKIRDKMQPIIDKMVAGELNEFETVANVQINKEDEESVDIDIADAVEEFKVAFKKKAQDKESVEEKRG